MVISQRFEFATANRIVFGPGTSADLPALARPFGRRIVVVTGAHPARIQHILDALTASDLEVIPVSIPGEPETVRVAELVAQLRSQPPDLVIGIGGGSVLDGAKALAGLVPQSTDLLEHLEVIGQGRPLGSPALPWIALPTTAGAGAEVTRNAVLTSREHRVKASLRSPLLLPRIALVDPELTYDLPPALTAATGLDALTQVIEPFTSARSNPFVDSLCRDAISRIADALPQSFEHPRDARAREDMALGALYGGLALANAGLGAVHGLAAPLGGTLHAPHGALCAALLPHVMQLNLRLLRARSPDSEAARRFTEIARLLTGSLHADASEGITWVKDLVRDLGIPALRAHGLARDQFPWVAQQALQASSMKANPVPLSQDQVVSLLEAAW